MEQRYRKTKLCIIGIQLYRLRDFPKTKNLNLQKKAHDVLRKWI